MLQHLERRLELCKNGNIIELLNEESIQERLPNSERPTDIIAKK